MGIIITAIVVGVAVIATAVGVVLFLRRNKNKAAIINNAVSSAQAAIDKATGGKL